MMIKVLEGGDGSTSDGRSERSSESGDLLPEEARERDGEGRVACMFATAIMCVEKQRSCAGCCVASRVEADSARSYIKRAHGKETIQLPHPSHVVDLPLRWGSAVNMPRPCQSGQILEPPAHVLLHVVLVWACTAQPGSKFACPPTSSRCCVWRCVGRHAARFGSAAD